MGPAGTSVCVAGSVALALLMAGVKPDIFNKPRRKLHATGSDYDYFFDYNLLLGSGVAGQRAGVAPLATEDTHAKGVLLKVPQDARPGERLVVSMPDGEKLNWTVPLGAKTGDTLTVLQGEFEADGLRPWMRHTVMVLLVELLLAPLLLYVCPKLCGRADSKEIRSRGVLRADGATPDTKLSRGAAIKELGEEITELQGLNATAQTARVVQRSLTPQASLAPRAVGTPLPSGSWTPFAENPLTNEPAAGRGQSSFSASVSGPSTPRSPTSTPSRRSSNMTAKLLAKLDFGSEERSAKVAAELYALFDANASGEIENGEFDTLASVAAEYIREEVRARRPEWHQDVYRKKVVEAVFRGYFPKCKCTLEELDRALKIIVHDVNFQ